MHDESSAECDRLRSLVEAAEAAMSSQQESTVALEEQVRLLRESAEAQRAEHSSDRAGLIDEHSSAIEHLQATMRSEALDAERERESRHAAMSDEHAAALSNAREEHAEAVSALRSTHEDELRSLASSHAVLSTEHEESVAALRSEHGDALRLASERHASSTAEMREQHEEGVAATAESHAAVLSSLKAEHASLVSLMRESEEALSVEAASRLAAVGADHDAALASAEESHASAIESMERAHASKVAELRSREEELRLKLSASEAEVEQMQYSSGSSLRSVNTLRAELSLGPQTAYAQQVQYSADRAHLLREHESSIHQMESAVKQVEQDRQLRLESMSWEHQVELFSEHEQHVAAISTLQASQLNETETAVAEIRQQYEYTTETEAAEVERLRALVSAADTTITTQEGSVANLEEQVQAQQSRLSAATEALKSVEAEHTSVVASMEHAHASALTDLKSEEEKLRLQLSAAEAEVEQMQYSADTSIDSVTSMSRTVNVLQEELGALEQSAYAQQTADSVSRRLSAAELQSALEQLEYSQSPALMLSRIESDTSPVRAADTSQAWSESSPVESDESSQSRLWIQPPGDTPDQPAGPAAVFSSGGAATLAKEQAKKNAELLRGSGSGDQERAAEVVLPNQTKRSPEPEPPSIGSAIPQRYTRAETVPEVRDSRRKEASAPTPLKLDAEFAIRHIGTPLRQMPPNVAKPPDARKRTPHPPSTPPPAPALSARDREIADKIRAIYRRVAPAKVAKVDDLLRRHKGQGEEVLRLVEMKYCS